MFVRAGHVLLTLSRVERMQCDSTGLPARYILCIHRWCLDDDTYLRDQGRRRLGAIRALAKAELRRSAAKPICQGGRYINTRCMVGRVHLPAN